MGDRAGVAYAAVPTHDDEEVLHRDVSKDGDRQRDQPPESDAPVAVKASWPVKTRWLLIALLLLALPVVVPCSLAAVRGNTCPDYWKGAGLFLFCGTLWASEAVPIWVTSVAVPLIAILLRIGPGTSKQIAHDYLSHFGEPNVLLMLGGFTLGRALQKLQIDRLLAGKVLSRAGSNPLHFLAAVMVACFTLSMALNNVVAPVLMIMVLRPLIRDSDSATNLPQALTLAVAFGCNIGGMPTPIASPQNAAAMVAMEAKCIGAAAAKSSCELGFAEWMGVGVPVGIVMLLASYIAIIVAYRPSVARVPVFDSGARVFFSWQHNVTCATLAATAALWCTFTFVSPYFGSLGAIGLIPVIVLHPHPHHAMLRASPLTLRPQVLHGSGILDVSDLRALDWHVLLLLGGGGALGRAIRESGLLHEVGNFIIWIMGANASPFALLAVFVAVILVITNFVSHTVASITMMPVVVEVVRCSLGKAVGPYVLPCVLATSAACILPVSSFPNIFTSSVQLADGRLVLSSSDYIKIGSVVAAAFFVVFAAVAYPLSFSVIKSC